MAVHNLGYRAWSGQLVPEWNRLWVICSSGIRRAWQSRWLRRMMFFAFWPKPSPAKMSPALGCSRFVDTHDPNCGVSNLDK